MVGTSCSPAPLGTAESPQDGGDGEGERKLDASHPSADHRVPPLCSAHDSRSSPPKGETESGGGLCAVDPQEWEGAHDNRPSHQEMDGHMSIIAGSHNNDQLHQDGDLGVRRIQEAGRPDEGDTDG